MKACNVVRVAALLVLVVGMTQLGAAEWENASSLPGERYALGTSVLESSASTGGASIE